MSISKDFRLDLEVAHALKSEQAVVALESTVVTHGLPYPENLAMARDMERQVRDLGATPATVAVLGGKVHIGLTPEQLELLAMDKGTHKLSTRDLAPAIAKGRSGGTTVAATMLAAHVVGIRVFATGGIGGVHRQSRFDISADLLQLAKTPMIVVCAGAKAILDLPATLEYLETYAVPVVGYQTDEFPAFYSRTSGLKASMRADSPAEVAKIAKIHWELGMHSALLVANPIPEEDALSRDEVEEVIEQALNEAEAQDIRGQRVTPFLLERLNEITSGASVRANLALLKNNARLAAEIARQLAQNRQGLAA